MPPARDWVVIIGATAAAVIAMLSACVALPLTFVARIVKLEVTAVVGIPKITPVAPFRLKPFGRLPLSIDHVIGAVPVAASVWV